MPGVSKEQIERARAVPLLDYLLLHEGGNFKRIGNAYYRRDPDHNSLEVSNNLWNWHSHGIGGDIIDYLVKINGYNFVDAVRELAGDDYTTQKPVTPKARPPTLSTSKSATNTKREPLQLPLRNADSKRVIAYLQGRGIFRPFIEDCIRRGILYESATHHNCVFVGRDDKGKARFAAMRGTTGNFKCDANGSDKRFGFCIPPDNPESKTVAVFESPIDCLSHKVIEPDFDGYRLSLGGTALVALTNFLERRNDIKTIIAATDNDDAGEQAAAKIAELAIETGLETRRAYPPVGKDWNETLTLQRNEGILLEDKRKDIIFRDQNYKEKFRIKDGESIKVTLGYNGEVVTRKCRWIDECHTKIGSEYYHNDEYAEKSAKVGNKTEPVKSAKPTIDILAAKYGEDLQAVAVPMTEAAIRKLVGGKYEAETLYYPNITNQIKDRIVEIKGKAFGAVIRGKDGIAVCGLNDGVLSSLHPYNEQTYKRELSPAERPAQEAPAPKKQSILGDLEATQKEVAAIHAARETGDKRHTRSTAEIG
ncbi:hypothetical protein FACS1894202_01390 [Clostridia bacterium]|nr:hypothetical protein FACS1894202_01390 [Clostridia bacterium]